MKTGVWCAMLSVLVVIACAGLAVASDVVRDDGTALRTPQPVVEVATPPGLDDGWRPLDQAPAGGATAAPADDPRAPAQTAARTASELLAAMTQAERANAVIQLEDHAWMRAAEGPRIDLAEGLWNEGRWDEAFEALEGLEAAVGPIGVALSWRTPIATDRGESVDATDVKISTRVAQHVVLDADNVSGHLFAAVRIDGGGWSMNMSTDGGRSWVETAWWAGLGASDIDMVVAQDYVYVAYIENSYENEAKVRRCLTTTGALDSGYGFFVVEDVSPDNVVSVALTSNADLFNSHVYYAYIRSNNTIHWYFEDAPDGTTWSERSPTVTNAASSLEQHFAIPGSTSYFWYLSYLGTDGQIWVDRSVSGPWSAAQSIWSSYDGATDEIHVSAFQDVVIVAFEDVVAPDHGIRYEISYNGGDNWASSSWFPGAGQTAFYAADVSARGGQGIALTHGHEVGGEPDELFFRMRPHYQDGPWTTSGTYNNQDLFTGRRLNIEWLAPLGSFGLGWVGGASQNPYFDRWPGLFYDDFERHNTSAWSAVYP